jgi:magnesium-transporting ATPase (P-type)
VDPAVGLREADAAQARRRWGPNELPPDPGTPFWKLVLKQFDDLLVKILIAAAAVSLLIGLADGEGWSSLVEPGVIVLILVANATVGVLTGDQRGESHRGAQGVPGGRRGGVPRGAAAERPRR